MPPDLDADIEAAAEAAGTTYSGWLADVARKQFIIQRGLEGVAAFEAEDGAFTQEERAEAAAWARDALERSRLSGSPLPRGKAARRPA